MARVVTKPVAIITGSASGIGLATMRRAAEVGYQAVRFEVAERRPPVAVAVGAAGSLTERPFASIGDDLWSEALEVHLRGIYNLTVAHDESPASSVPGGFRGVGESGIIGAPAAIAGAVRSSSKGASSDRRELHVGGPWPRT